MRALPARHGLSLRKHHAALAAAGCARCRSLGVQKQWVSLARHYARSVPCGMAAGHIPRPAEAEPADPEPEAAEADDTDQLLRQLNAL